MAGEFTLAIARTELKLEGRDAFNSALGRVKGGLTSLRQKLEGVSRAAKIMGAAIVAAMVFAVKAAADAQDVMTKFRAVFEEQTEAAEKWAEAYAKSINRTGIEIKQQLANTQDLLVPWGFAREEATKFSKSVVVLGQDLAAFDRKAIVGGAIEAIDRLTKGMSGSREAMNIFGVTVRDVDIKMQLLKNGVEGGTLAATQAEKAFATYQLVLEGTKDAQGAASKNQANFNARLEELKSRFMEQVIVMGDLFMPLAEQVVKWVQMAIVAYSQLSEETKTWVTVGAIAGVILSVITVASIAAVAAIAALVIAFEGLAAVVAFVGPLLAVALAALIGIAALAGGVGGVTAIKKHIAEISNEVAEQNKKIKEDALKSSRELFAEVAPPPGRPEDLKKKAAREFKLRSRLIDLEIDALKAQGRDLEAARLKEKQETLEEEKKLKELKATEVERTKALALLQIKQNREIGELGISLKKKEQSLRGTSKLESIETVGFRGLQAAFQRKEDDRNREMLRLDRIRNNHLEQIEAGVEAMNNPARWN